MKPGASTPGRRLLLAGLLGLATLATLATGDWLWGRVAGHVGSAVATGLQPLPR